jgi:hypothetical protein
MMASGEITSDDSSDCYADDVIVDMSPLLSDMKVDFTDENSIVMLPCAIGSYFSMETPNLSAVHSILRKGLNEGRLFNCANVLAPFAFDRSHWVLFFIEKKGEDMDVHVIDTLQGFVTEFKKEIIGMRMGYFLKSNGTAISGGNEVRWRGEVKGVPQQKDGIVCGYAVMDIIGLNLGKSMPLRFWKSVPPIRTIACKLIDVLLLKSELFFYGKNVIKS